MPFSNEFNNVRDVIKLTVDNIKYSEEFVCNRLDDKITPGRITENLLKEIQDAHIIISDVTDNNPNVMWETGYAMALHKPIIQLTQSIKDLPFDLKDTWTIFYNKNDLFSSLSKKLADSINETLKEYEIDILSPIESESDKTIFSISVTGSMMLDINKSKRRFKNIIKPYVGKKISWYIGSFGDVDEMITSYLCEIKEKVIIVGYHALDLTTNMVNLIKTYKLPFIDSQKEQLPNYPQSPSERDVYMSFRSDLTILLWDGKSQGTKRLINWYRIIKKDHVITFV